MKPQTGESVSLSLIPGFAESLWKRIILSTVSWGNKTKINSKMQNKKRRADSVGHEHKTPNGEQLLSQMRPCLTHRFFLVAPCKERLMLSHCDMHLSVHLSVDNHRPLKTNSGQLMQFFEQISFSENFIFRKPKKINFFAPKNYFHPKIVPNLPENKFLWRVSKKVIRDFAYRNQWWSLFSIIFSRLVCKSGCGNIPSMQKPYRNRQKITSHAWTNLERTYM